ncbi:UNVERIFIED_CONTAM: hypothetical protein FKN15_039160 [Acipenser sinensis]
MGCIKNYWDQTDHTGVYSCPQCRDIFIPRPVLRRNTMLAEVVDKLKKTGLSPPPAQSYAGPGDVSCDFCTGRKFKAVKSCLTCLVSYCETHVKPHYEGAAFKRHKLINAIGNLEQKLCAEHQKVLEVFCRTDQTCICLLCTDKEHKSHDTVSAEAERTGKQCTHLTLAASVLGARTSTHLKLSAWCSVLQHSALLLHGTLRHTTCCTMSGFHRCVTCGTKLPANDPHEDCVSCLGPEHAASALADKAFCTSCAAFQTRTLRRRARRAVGDRSPSSGSSHTLSAPQPSLASPPPKLPISRSSSSQVTAGQRSPDARHFIKEVQSTWETPASAPATSRKAAAFTMQGASEAGLASFPPVGAAFAALVKSPTLSGLAKDPTCPNKQCRTTEVHLKRGYSAATEAVRLSNLASLLSVYQAALVKDLPDYPSVSLRAELGLIAQLLVKLAQLNARAQGRSIASLVVARRQLWLSQARVQEHDKAPLLDAPITPGHTFGPAVEEMLQRSAKAKEASQQLATIWPRRPFQVKRPQEHQWRRTPPQHQPRPGGTKTFPASTAARGQIPFGRPQRTGWRPRGTGQAPPHGAGQAPRERAQPKQP